MRNSNHEANISNSNYGTSGTNDAYQDMLDNRSDQLNPNNSKFKGN